MQCTRQLQSPDTTIIWLYSFIKDKLQSVLLGLLHGSIQKKNIIKDRSRRCIHEFIVTEYGRTRSTRNQIWKWSRRHGNYGILRLWIIAIKFGNRDRKDTGRGRELGQGWRVGEKMSFSRIAWRMEHISGVNERY